MRNIRTDLAFEMREALQVAAQGVAVNEEVREDGWTITTVEISTPDAAEQLGKPCGRYVTVEVPALKGRDPALGEQVSACLAEQLATLMPRLRARDTVLVVGLGNRAITADAVGPETAAGILTTRHIFHHLPEAVDARMRPVCALTPGVLGVTGLETLEVVRGVVHTVRPSAVILIDALAARSVERIGTTFQLWNTGLQPGSGVGNHRRALNAQTLGLPVICLGIPTVVHACTLIGDLLEMLKQADPVPDAESLLETLVVTPKEIDQVTADMAAIAAMGINRMLHAGMTSTEIRQMMA